MGFGSGGQSRMPAFDHERFYILAQEQIYSTAFLSTQYLKFRSQPLDTSLLWLSLIVGAYMKH